MKRKNMKFIRSTLLLCCDVVCEVGSDSSNGCADVV